MNTENLFTINNVWMMFCTALVFIMHLGFATLEAGLTRKKNAVNILFKNTFIICFSIFSYGFIGFALMYPGEFNGILGMAEGSVFLKDGLNPDNMTQQYNMGYTFWTDFLFQAMFAATTASIVSGAVAERINLGAFILFAIPFVAYIYPILGSWKWGGGWLDSVGFYDFAGSTLVHSVGGWAALIGAIMVGPRIGKYDIDGKPNPILGHSMPLATIGTFLLWLGWFGFNGGSVLSADPGATSLTLVTTSASAAGGGLYSMITCMGFFKKLDLSMFLNGILAGLVGITAGADQMNFIEALIIGMVSGGIVVLSVVCFDKLKIDDPVGAISVHLVCGVWGTLAVGLFGHKAGIQQFLIQLVGVLSYGIATLVCSYVIFRIAKVVLPLRASFIFEDDGLDVSEHGSSAYN